MSLSRLGQATVRAAALIDIGRCADALPLLHQAIAQDPDDLNARCLLGLALMREGRWQEAEIAARDAIAVAPAHGRAHSLRAYTLKALNRRDEALQEAQRGVELDPTTPDRYQALVQVALDWRTDVAQAASETLLRLAPESAEAHFRAGTVSMFRGEYPEAEAFMRRALSLDPTYRGAHNNLGVTLIRQGRRAEAFAAYQRAAALDPSDQT
ncbi:MAG: tetratricopeptide repeat protein, partial [Candidatus Dormiibacterota bacterium]